jgi:hypothetical protein
MCFGLPTLLTGSLLLLLTTLECDPQRQFYSSVQFSQPATILQLADNNRSPIHRGSGRCEFFKAFDFSSVLG